MQSASTYCVGALMNFTRAVAAALIVAAAGFFPEGAEARTKKEVPAEFPPADYTGRQYVDSKGCVFIRANTGGLVDWIPRVTRQRQHICNAKPTFAAAPAADLPVIADPAPTAVEITVAPDPAPAPARVAAPVRSAARTAATDPLPLPAPMRAAAPAPAAEPTPVATTQRQPRFTLASLFAPRQRVVQREPVVAAPTAVVAPAPVAAPVSVAPAGVAACPGGLSISERYLGTGAGVRCGPQAISPVGPRLGSGVTVRDPGDPAAAGATQSYTRVARGSDRVVPSHVYANQQNAQKGVTVPKGYRPVWSDDRLNPKRAHQTLAGKAQMDLIWTQTVPRQLIDRASGRDVTRFFPGLTYPNTSYAQQDGAIAATPTVSSKSRQPVAVTPAARSQPKAVAKAQPKAAKATYVQVAMFAQPGNAQRTAGNLAAKGLPMRIWNAKRGGKAVQLVVVGPFADASQARGALSVVKRAGFSDAYLR